MVTYIFCCLRHLYYYKTVFIEKTPSDVLPLGKSKNELLYI